MLNLLISDAHAQAAAPGAAPDWSGLIMLLVMFVIMFFLIIRPQAKRAKEHRELVAKLSLGDEIITTGGLLARITGLGETHVVAEIAEGVQVRVQKEAVSAVLPRGTLKTL